MSHQKVIINSSRSNWWGAVTMIPKLRGRFILLLLKRMGAAIIIIVVVVVVDDDVWRVPGISRTKERGTTYSTSLLLTDQIRLSIRTSLDMNQLDFLSVDHVPPLFTGCRLFCFLQLPTQWAKESSTCGINPVCLGSTHRIKLLNIINKHTCPLSLSKAATRLVATRVWIQYLTLS